MPSLACLFALSDLSCFGLEGFMDAEGSPMIPMEHTRMAAQWCTCLEAHANRIYSPIITPALQPTNILADHILNRKVGVNELFTVRDIEPRDWRGLRSDSEIESALSVLLGKKSVIQLPDARSSLGGRPTVRYQINPKVLDRFGSVN